MHALERLLTLFLVICFSVPAITQSDFIQDRGPAYELSDQATQHFKYLQYWNGDHYLRKGDDKEQSLVRVNSHNEEVKTIAASPKFLGKQAFFESLIETPTGVYGLFIVPLTKSRELVVAIATFDGNQFGQLREVYRHGFVKILGAFKHAYPFVSRSWRDGQRSNFILRQSPDGEKVVYISYQKPFGYAVGNRWMGIHIVVFNNEFVIEREVTISDYSQLQGGVMDAVVDNNGQVWTVQAAYMQKGDWENSAREHLPNRKYMLGKVTMGIEEIELPLEPGKIATNLAFSWDKQRGQYRISGTYTTGEYQHYFSGSYFGILTDQGLGVIKTNEVNATLLKQPIVRLKRGLVVKSEHSSLEEIVALGISMKLRAVNYNQDKTISWLYESEKEYEVDVTHGYNQVTKTYLRATYDYLAKDILYCVRTDESGSMLNQQVYDKTYWSPQNASPATLVFNEDDAWHIIFPKKLLPAPKEKIKQSEQLLSNLEYLVLNSKGEKVASEVLMSKLAHFYDFYHPLAVANDEILFAKMDRYEYSMGSYPIKQ